MSERQSTAVLLMAYGGPDSLVDIPAYLLDIRHGRSTPQVLIDEITERYHQIGGKSPLLDITRSAAQRLQERIGLPVYVGMRHWKPFIKEVVAQMAADGVRHIIGICMAPHYSTMSIGAYRRKLEEAIDATGLPISLDFIASWHIQPDYLTGVEVNVRETMHRFPEGERLLVIFSAHSLPESILEQGDPYDDQLRETASLLAEKLNLPDDSWTFSYQSAAKTGVPWLGPQIEDLVVDLAQRGKKNLLIAPIGFIADHVEVLYDLDIGVRSIAHQHGIRVERTPMLNDSQPLIAALAALAGSRIGSKA
jgi:protoporphyrin/coproporphyrin ferrochelatase